MITPYGWQIKAARAALGWTQRKLAKRSQIGVGTIKRLERMSGPIKGQYATIAALLQTLEHAGLELLNQEAPGVRLRPAKRKNAKHD